MSERNVDYIEVARAETARGEVVLRERRGPDDGSREGASGVLELRVNGVFVMDSLETSSERLMATTALQQVANPNHVLVAGLGLGFTMHEVLADRRVERLVVVEIEEALVGWMRDGTVPHGPTYLADDRLKVVTADIRLAMAEATPAAYDLVLLDVDNGPDHLVHQENAAIYEIGFLQHARAALRPDGAIVVWSAAESGELRQRLGEVFGNVAVFPYDVQLQTREERYWLYLSRAVPA